MLQDDAVSFVSGGKSRGDCYPLSLPSEVSQRKLITDDSGLEPVLFGVRFKERKKKLLQVFS